jgi:hypothetical protein
VQTLRIRRSTAETREIRSICFLDTLHCFKLCRSLNR